MFRWRWNGEEGDRGTKYSTVNEQKVTSKWLHDEYVYAFAIITEKCVRCRNRTIRTFLISKWCERMDKSLVDGNSRRHTTHRYAYFKFKQTKQRTKRKKKNTDASNFALAKCPMPPCLGQPNEKNNLEKYQHCRWQHQTIESTTH